MATKIISEIRDELKDNADDLTRESGKRFFKEEVKLYGVKTAAVSKIGKKYFAQIKDKEKKEIFALCEELLSSGYMEESFIACNWSYYLHDKYAPSDYPVFESWVEKYVSNWAACDTLCNHTIGTFVEKFPYYVKNLKRWSKTKNRWMRRASAVSLILPARRGLFLKDVFEISDILLKDPDDLVQKGYGWMLKEASKAHQKEVYSYIIANKKEMPRTALRYAIEKMPQELKKKAMGK